MDDFLALELNRRKDFLEKIVIEKTAALAQSGPEGRLRCVDRNGRPEYYWRKDGKDVTGTYIPVGRQEFAAALAQLGIMGDTVRLPLAAASDATRTLMQKVLAELWK